MSLPSSGNESVFCANYERMIYAGRMATICIRPESSPASSLAERSAEAEKQRKSPPANCSGAETVYWQVERASGRPEFYPRRLWGCNANCRVPKTEGPPGVIFRKPNGPLGWIEGERHSTQVCMPLVVET